MCRCGRRINVRGLHRLFYKCIAGRHPRHAALNYIIKRGVQSTDFLSIFEPVRVDRGDG